MRTLALDALSIYSVPCFNLVRGNETMNVHALWLDLEITAELLLYTPVSNLKNVPLKVKSENANLIYCKKKPQKTKKNNNW